MPEGPEVEVLVRHLDPLLRGRVIQRVVVSRPKIVRPDSLAKLQTLLREARFQRVSRRGKYLLFDLETRRGSQRLVGHLGMTGRMFVQPRGKERPRHAAVVLELDRDEFIFEDTRYFGRLTLSQQAVEALGPEPLEHAEPPEEFVQAMQKSRRPVKVLLLDQAIVASVGNIYASEACHVAGISPKRAGTKLREPEIARLWSAVRSVLEEAIRFGSTVPLAFGSDGTKDGLFYYGRPDGAEDFYEERLRVYDRAGQPCRNCGQGIRRIVQAARSTYFCPRCQK